MNLTRQYPVGNFSCHWTLTIADGQPNIIAAWEPLVPTIEDMSAEMWDEYREGRNAFMQEVAEALGGNVAVVETARPVMNGHG